ncbi:MAG: hypothetical protein LBR58_05130 [Propionibacteriaceae bacterium]|nr:hypothetical protein [Propionibacteriaceae bacterium]
MSESGQEEFQNYPLQPPDDGVQDPEAAAYYVPYNPPLEGDVLPPQSKVKQFLKDEGKAELIEAGIEVGIWVALRMLPRLLRALARLFH